MMMQGRQKRGLSVLGKQPRVVAGYTAPSPSLTTLTWNRKITPVQPKLVMQKTTQALR